MTRWEIILIGWSAVTFVWWLVALTLLARGPRAKSVSVGLAPASVTVFKPLPPVDSEEDRAALAEAIESFIAQLRSEDEIILGVDTQAESGWKLIIARWRGAWPAARILVVERDAPTQHANPKIAWLEVLGATARGEIWLWSDADVTVPAGFLYEVSTLLNTTANCAVTAAYAVRRIHGAKGVLDALFVNVEFLPGALLLDWVGRKEFAYGAATAFRAETFRTRVNWKELGAELADDHELGRRLQPVALCPTLVSTFTLPHDWWEAWQHYYRWQKTVRWCRPSGFAALVILLPVLGWATAFVANRGAGIFLFGLAGQWLGEMTVAALACWIVGCRLPPRTWAGVMLWPLARAVTWVAVWLPLPVMWSGRERAWFAPKRYES